MLAVKHAGRTVYHAGVQLYFRLGRGEVFGEIALLLNVPRTATVRAVVSTTLLALEARDFYDVLAGYLGRADALERLSHLRLLSHKRLDEVVQGDENELAEKEPVAWSNSRFSPQRLTAVYARLANCI